MIKINRTRRIALLTLVFISILALNITGCGKDAPVATLKVGESYTQGSWIITVTEAKVSSTLKSLLGTLPAKSEKQFVLVSISFENTLSERALISFEALLPYLLADKDGKYGLSDAGYEVLDNPFPYGYVEAGNTMTGVFPFEIPAVSKDLVLSVLFNGETILWELD